MPDSRIRVERHGRVAVIVLTHGKMNTVTLDMTRELGTAATALAADPEVGALVLTGEGERSFCAGSEIREFPQLCAEKAIVRTKLGPENDAYGKIAHFPKPTVAAIEGVALGGGLELASGCDILVASAGSRLGLPEIKLGGFPGSGGTVRVTRRIGMGRAKEMMLLGDMISAETALAWGLINRIAPDGEAKKLALEIATRLADAPAQAAYACKTALENAFDLPESEAIARSLELSETLSQTRDFNEGVHAFVEKRQARFTDVLSVADFAQRAPAPHQS